MKTFIKRLLPGSDLKGEIEKIVSDQNIKAGCILSLVGSLHGATLRIADGETVKSWDDDFEIVSGIGTLSINGCHIHVALGDKQGNVIGGHLKQGCVVNTTVELIIGIFENKEFVRRPDGATGYDELEVLDKQ